MRAAVVAAVAAPAEGAVDVGAVAIPDDCGAVAAAAGTGRETAEVG